MKAKEFDKLGKRDFENGAVLNEIHAALKELEQLKVTNGWRSAKDELPELYEFVLISGKEGILTCCLNSPAWNDSKPTHWMPLPSKPEL